MELREKHWNLKTPDFWSLSRYPAIHEKFKLDSL